MKLLYLSNAVPYDQICHAGGKTFNYYVKKALQMPNVEIKVIGLCKESEQKDFDFVTYGLQCYPVCTCGAFQMNIRRVLMDLWGICAFRKKCGQSYFKTYMLLKIAKQIKKEGFIPEIVVLEWTNIVLMAKEVKKIFPNAVMVASEHDVSFLGAQRKIHQAKGIKKKYLESHYHKLKKSELEAIKLCKVVMPHSSKDKKLLVKNGIDVAQIHVLTPYFHNLSYLKRSKTNYDILFWGAMYRSENYEAALWFIDKVMPLLSNTEVRFIVVGNRPPQRLIDCASKKIIITGFVEDETPYFEHSLCFVSPLLTGAGIKVKVIEALSAGIPILTNDIGIEGILAKDGVSYFHCTEPEEYAEVIRNILVGRIDSKQLYKEQQEVVEKNFDLEKSACNYTEMLRQISNNNIPG